MFGFTFYNILRDASLGHLKQRDTDRLRDYQTLLELRIEEKKQQLLRPNKLSNELTELREDIRWYKSISETISGILTEEFHQKAA